MHLCSCPSPQNRQTSSRRGPRDFHFAQHMLPLSFCCGVFLRATVALATYFNPILLPLRLDRPLAHVPGENTEAGLRGAPCASATTAALFVNARS